MGGNISIKDKNYLRLILITYVTIDNVAGIGIFLNYTFFDIYFKTIDTMSEDFINYI